MNNPKMQLSPDVMVSDQFRAEINAWMIDFFGYEEDEQTSVVPPIVHNDVTISIPKTPKKDVRKPKSKTQVQPNMETFGALLEGLEDSFGTMRSPDIPGSWLAKRDVNAIKKIGVYIPTPFAVQFLTKPLIPAGTKLPAIASALFIPRKEETEVGKVYPRFAFCIKGARLPESVEATKGTPYQFGQCFEMTRDESGKPVPPKTFWAWCWMVVRPDGSIHIPYENRSCSEVIKRSKKGNKAPKLAYRHRQWSKPSLAIAEAARDQTTHEQFMASTLRQLILWWNNRSSQWSVGVRKDGHRVTFSIAPEYTSAYFADRDTVVNVEGKPKKIIHFVRKHTRVTGSEVKAHVRGLREFDWKGYHCVVTAPELNGAIFTDFNLDPSLVDTKESDQGYMDTLGLASMLSDAEDGRKLRKHEHN